MEYFIAANPKLKTARDFRETAEAVGILYRALRDAPPSRVSREREAEVKVLSDRFDLYWKAAAYLESQGR
jgi:hypothetical protein